MAFDEMALGLVGEKLLDERRIRSRFAPLGFREGNGGLLVKDPREQKILRRMLKLRESGKGPTEIASKLNAE